MMPGMIMLWYGAVVDIPTGWTLCDGNNGSPDLTDRFVLGAGWHYDPDDTGGVNHHKHTFTGDGHAHDLVAGVAIEGGLLDGDYVHQTTTTPATGDTQDLTTVPPYYALCYIMKTPVT